jgi:hypothetical protein
MVASTPERMVCTTAQADLDLTRQDAVGLAGEMRWGVKL